MKNTLIISPNDSNIEIERKFLLKNNIPELTAGRKITQAYIFTHDDKELRIRIVDNVCTLSIKIGAGEISRIEFEYEIPIEEGQRLIELGSSKGSIEKIRYIVPFEGINWEIDIFKGENEGLMIAEIELDHPLQHFVKPPWLGNEVTDDRRYYNAYIYHYPYKSWNTNETLYNECKNHPLQ
jgi:CYTH domain-containing protein